MNDSSPNCASSQNALRAFQFVESRICRGITAVFLVAAIGGIFLTAPSASAANTKPNVLILVSDDQGWGDVGYHGGEMATPNIDKLVEEGLEMNRFYAYPICTPTRTSLLTGHISMRHDIFAPSQNLGHDPQLMNQAFKNAGYMTMTAGKWHLGRDTQRDFPINRGFDHTYGSLNAGPDYWTHGRGEVKDWGRDGRTVHENGYATDLFGNEISRLIRDRDPSKPFFSYVAFTAPHTPLQAPQEYVDKYAHIEDEDRRIYCAMVEVLDVAIGNILQAVDDEGIRDNTLVLFFSDNGGSAGADNGDFRGRKGQVYEGGTRLPAIFRWPGVIPAGVRSEQPVVVYDIFPTFVEALGIPTKLNMPFDGESVWDTLQSGKTRSRKTDILIGNSTAYSVHSGEYKLVHSNVNKNTPDAPAETIELFKIYDDPNETKDVSKANPDVVNAMLAKNRFMAEMIGNAPFRAPRGARGGVRAGGRLGGRPGGPGGRGGNAVAAGGPGGGDQVAAGPRVGGAGWSRYGGGRPSSAPIVRDANDNIVHLHESIPE